MATYTVEGGSFRAGTPRLWSEARLTDRGLNRVFDLHPDGRRFAVLSAPGGRGSPALIGCPDQYAIT